MKLQDAVQIFGFVEGAEITTETIKATYRKLVAKYHPDRNPGGTEMMKAVNAARDALDNAMSNDWTVKPSASNDADYGDALNDAINAVIDLQGIVIEVCGAWVWITGETKANAKALKAAKYRWAPKKTAWYFRPANYKSRARGQFTLDEVRAMHGSETVTGAKQGKRKLSH